MVNIELMANLDTTNIGLAIGVGIVCLVVGFVGGLGFAGMRPQTVGSVTSLSKLDIFTTATGSIQGMVTKVGDGMATVKNSAGVEGDYKVSDQVSVFTLKPGVKQATSSAGLDESLLNRKVIVNLIYKNGQFEIVSVSVIPEMTTPPPALKKK